MRKKAEPFTEPAEVTEARRVRFAQLIDEAGGETRVAAKAGLDRVHLEKLSTKPSYTTGPKPRPLHRDILTLRTDTIRKLLPALNISDSAAIRELNIPKHLHSRWMTTREAPMGQAKGGREGLLDVILNVPVVVTLQPGHLVTVDTENLLSGDILIRLNGRYLVTPADAIPANAEALGQVVGMDTLVRRPVPAP